jgi:hypothetical protein
MNQKILVAAIAIALGKKTIAAGQPVDGLFSAEQLAALVKNNSVVERDLTAEELEAVIAEAEAKLDEQSEPEDSDEPQPDPEPEEPETDAPVDSPEIIGIDPGAGDDQSAVLVGATDAEGRIVELREMSVAELKALAAEMEIAGASRMNKADLVAAISAVEFKLIDDEVHQVEQ